MKIFCVIPAYNEEKHIVDVIRDVKPFVDEIVVVDDASNDRTAELALAEKVKVLSHTINRHQGAALETGNRFALDNGADIIVHFDADGQFNAHDIKDVILPIRNGETDVVFGSRFMSIRSKLPFFKEYIIIPLARIANRIFLNVRLKDPQCGFRAMSKSAALNIRIEQDGMAHCSEIISKVVKKNLRYIEVPIKVTYNEFGQNFSGGLRIINDLFLKELTK